MWKASTQLGCAVRSCNSLAGASSPYSPVHLVVCRYSPSGNWDGEQAANVLPVVVTCAPGSGVTNGTCTPCSTSNKVSAGGPGVVCGACAAPQVPNTNYTACTTLEPFAPPADAVPYNYSLYFAGADYDAVTTDTTKLAAFSAALRQQVAAAISSTGSVLSPANVEVASLARGSIVASVAVHAPAAWSAPQLAAMNTTLAAGAASAFAADFLTTYGITAVNGTVYGKCRLRLATEIHICFWRVCGGRKRCTSR